jgi:hypothetical protein
MELGVMSSALRTWKMRGRRRSGARTLATGKTVGLDTSIFLSMATAHPVVGAALIRRYSSVRLRGGQLGRIPSVL